MMIQILHPWVVGIGLCGVTVAALYRFFWYKPIIYVTPYTALIQRLTFSRSSYVSYATFISGLRIISMSLLVFATAQLTMVDEQSKLKVDGSDMMLVMDVSGSMQLFDDPHDQRSRFDVARQEVLNFIKNRQNDPIGLIIFGATAVSRCPLTLDKKMLHDIVSELALGDISADSTVLGIGLSMAVNRLRHSKSATKIVILLTDGTPTENDIPLEPVIALAKKYGIKIYTIGVGGPQGGYGYLPLHGLMRFETPLNVDLLKTIAQETGGMFFQAEKPEDIKRVYQTIDTLEKTSYDIPLYARYHDLFMSLIIIVIGLLGIELILRWWRVIV